MNCVVLLQRRNLLGTSQISFTFWEKKTKRAWVSSVPSFEKHTLDFRSQTSNFQSFEKKEGVDFWGFFFFRTICSLRGGDQRVCRITLIALTLNNL